MYSQVAGQGRALIIQQQALANLGKYLGRNQGNVSPHIIDKSKSQIN